MQNNSQIGLIGLAVMGANLALNIANHGYKISVFNRSPERTKEFLDANKNPYLTGHTELNTFVSSLATPRQIILMVKAGTAVDQVIEQILPLLSPGDLLIDAGNSLYSDTQRRVLKLAEHQLEFVGMGVSGGEEGALKGPSLMPGGKAELWQRLSPVLRDIAAKDFSGEPCVTWVGADGAGHFVKMVHNGIEYAIMQLIAETYWLLKKSNFSNQEIADVFAQWDQGILNSFLTSLVPSILRTKDPQTGTDLIDQILDTAAQKGTGAWTVKDALDRGLAIPSISEAVFARSLSSNRQLRQNLADLQSPSTSSPLAKPALPDLEQALFAGIVLAYAQGFALIQTTAREQNWQIDLAETARIWQGGCIIRSQLLTIIQEIFLKNGNLQHLLATSISEMIAPGIQSLPKILMNSLAAGVPLPVFSATYQYFLQITAKELPTNLIQALRDCFGAHTYQRRDLPGDFHTEWQ